MNYRRSAAALLLLSAGAGIILLCLIENVKAEPRSQVRMPFMRIDPGLDSPDEQGIAQAEALVPMDPVYAAREISIFPYPVMLGQPTEICVEVRNPTSEGQDVVVNFAWAQFGIGLPFTPINGPRMVHLPPNSVVKECIHWVPPVSGQVCVEVTLDVEGLEPLKSQRNVDVNEPLKPGVTDQLTFPVGNPYAYPVDISLGIVPHKAGWGIEMDTDVLLDVQTGETRFVTLSVTPPTDAPVLTDGELIVDVEAYVEDVLLSGFRKVFRPPVPLHVSPDPPYAEREISVFPYPVMVGVPTEICVELRNPISEPQDVVVNYAWANFGIGLPFTPINGPRLVHLPPHSLVKECIHWVPPVSGHICLEVTLEMDGYAPQKSQRNLDVDEPLEPGLKDQLTFPVGNPYDHEVDISLGIVPHQAGWGIELSPDLLTGVKPGEIREVYLYVTPPQAVPLPVDGAPVVDVEAYVGDVLLGGFRKVFRPPIPLHVSPDPPYAEREISVFPYPVKVGEPTEICVEHRNPTSHPQDVVVHYAWANFGIGLPFAPINGPNMVHLPPYSIVNECIHWVPPVSGHICLEVNLEMEGYAPQKSQRNLDVDEPLEPGVKDQLTFPVGNPYDHVVDISLGIVPHQAGWGIDLEPDVLTKVEPGEIREVTLSVTPPAGIPLPPGVEPVLDVEAFVDGRLIGGFRKEFHPSGFDIYLPLLLSILQ